MDTSLHRLMSYIHHSCAYRMYAWVGSDQKIFSLDVYSDSDYAGCTETQRSTTGSIVFSALRLCRCRSPLYPKRQGFVSRSTPEAEIVAMDTTIRVLTLPALSMAEELSPRVKVRICGDYQAMLCVMKTGRNPAMRHLSRTHRVSIAWLHEQ